MGKDWFMGNPIAFLKAFSFYRRIYSHINPLKEAYNEYFTKNFGIFSESLNSTNVYANIQSFYGIIICSPNIVNSDIILIFNIRLSLLLIFIAKIGNL